jgi:hypothetical protein
MRSVMVFSPIAAATTVLRAQPTHAFLSEVSLGPGLAQCNAGYIKSSRLNSYSIRPDDTIALRLSTVQKCSQVINMPHSLEVVTCQACGCTNETVLPYSNLLQVRQQSPRRTAAGDPYLEVACPRCKHVFRYTPDMTRERVYDTRDPYQPPALAVWFGVFLKCESERCASYLEVESAMVSSATANDINAFISNLLLDDAVKCLSGHQAKRPLEVMWAAILFPIWSTIQPYRAG